MYQVIFYWDDRNESPVLEFIEQLPKKARQKVAAWIELLEQKGPRLQRPYADKVVGNLYELRVRFASDNIRILYFFYLRDKIILVHAFRKKDSEIKRRELEMAQRRVVDFMDRYQKGKIKF